ARAAKHSDDAEGEKTLFDAGTLGALTPAYASCEMLDGDEPDKRDDIYALGCTAYELLAGKHPFGKKKATVARTKKLTPATIKGLSKREYRALVRALAFDRDDRSASAMHFLDELMPKKSGRGLVIGASAAAAVMLAVLGGVVIPPWLHERKMEQYVVSLRDGTDEEIWQVLPEVLALPDGDQSDIFGTVKDRVIDAYERRINEQIDASRGRYDYPAAERFVSELRSLFTDSQRVSSIDSRVDEGKRQEELRQTTRYNDLLAAGALLPKDDEDDITDVLAIMRQVAPDSTLLTDPRLSGAYAEAAEAQLENDLNLGLARQLLEAGLVEFPNDATMVDLLDSVSARQRRIEMAARIEELETQVAAAAPGLASVEDIAALRDTLLELGELNAESEVLAAARTRAGSIVSSVLDDRVESREWVQATGLLQRYSPVLDETFVQTQRDRITAAEDSHTARMTGLFDEFLRAVQAGRLDSPATGSAQDFLQQLVDAGADAAMLQQARSGLGQAYLSRAREARAATNYDEARAQVQLGLNVQPGETLERSLLAENTEIDTSEQLQQTLADEAARERLAAERQARIEALRDEFQQGLRADTFRTETASALLQTLDQLAAVSPTDPLLTNGRAEVGRRLTELARAEAAAGNWDAAIELATDSLVVIPDSELLSSTLADLRSQRDANERQVQAEQLQQRRDRLDALLASPQYNDNWDNEVRNELAALSSMMAADDPYLSARRDQAARLYLGQATERRLEQRFSEANAMLDRGLRFAQLAEIETERELVEAARAAFEAERAQQNRLAKIEGDKQTFLVQARADSVTKAKATLATLSQALPANDTFLTTTAPDALASAYERLAGQSAERGSLDAALRFANAGLEYMPDRASLVQARDDYDRRNNRQRVSNTLSSGSASDVAGLTSLLGTVRAQDDNYASTEQEYADLLASRIRRLERSDYEQAQGLLTAGRSLFSGNATLASLSLTAPVVTPPVQEPPPVATVTPPPTTTPPPATTTTPTQTASRPGKACTPSLAGYGSRGGRGVCYDNLPGNVRGPDLVVVPAAPGGQVYAITRYEVTAGEYADYCRISGECSYTARAENLPLTDVSLADAEKFINWLSGVTAANYRLPSVDEWEHAAGANGSQPSRDYNCQIRDIQGQLVKGLGLVSVNSGDRNGWGLYNYVGNAQEWVRAGSGVQARGGAYTDSLSNCSISLSRQHSGNADPVTGFRLVRVID
ncbi:MAG: SUMF1/EgtB/PvdO family nonheme iron enzyme, partial [Pseudomonadota bacterium]